MKIKNVVISLLIILFVLIVLSFFYPSGSELGKGFTVIILYMFIRQITLYAGLLLLFLRIFFFPKLSTTIVYFSIVLLNMGTALVGTILYFLQQANREWLHDCLLNALLGACMLLLSTIRNRKKEKLS